MAMSETVFVIILLFGINIFLLSHGCFYNTIQNPSGSYQDDPRHQYGKPLFLTKVVQHGDRERAWYLSKVGPLPNASFDNIISHSGFLTVDKVHDSNLFFWFFPAMNGDHCAPLIVWLQGGPGLSSLIGVFVEHGPLAYDHLRDEVYLRNHSWAETFNMLYIDNPVGTGFSFTNCEEGYANNHSQIAVQLYDALNQFFTIFPRYKANGIYLAGEGYACKYVTTLAHHMHVLSGGPHRLELKGIIVGNGICDRPLLLNHSDFFINLDLVSRENAKTFNNMSLMAEDLLGRRRYGKAIEIMKSMYFDRPSKASLLRKVSGLDSLYDIRYTGIPNKLHMYTKYLATSAVRKALHVGDLSFNGHEKVCRHLMSDLSSSVKIPLQTLLHDYKVLLYHGQLDGLVPYKSFLGFIRELRWRDRPYIHRRTFWTVRNSITNKKHLAGFVNHKGDFYQAVVYKAGHFAAMDAPMAVSDMVQRFIWGKTFH